MHFNNRTKKSLIWTVGLWLMLAGSLSAQKPNDGNQPNQNSNNSFNKSGNPSNSRNADFSRPNPNGPNSGQKNSGGQPEGSQQGFPPVINPNQGYYNPSRNEYGNPVPGMQPGVQPWGAFPSMPSQQYGSIYNPASPYAQEIMIYREGKFKVVENANDPALFKEGQEGFQKLQEAVKVLRSESNSDAERSEARNVLTQFLEAHFENDQKKRQEQVASLEAQVAKLKAQLEKRADSKSQLIELRIKLLENDASGLAFPQSWTHLPGLENNSALPPQYPVPMSSNPVPMSSNPVGTLPSPVTPVGTPINLVPK